MSRDKQNIKATDWLTRGMTEEELEREKREAVLSAYLELCITYDEETKGIDFDATAEKLVAEGYAKTSEVAEKIFAEIERETKNHGITYTQRKIAELKKKYTESEKDNGEV